MRQLVVKCLLSLKQRRTFHEALFPGGGEGVQKHLDIDSFNTANAYTFNVVIDAMLIFRESTVDCFRRVTFSVRRIHPKP